MAGGASGHGPIKIVYLLSGACIQSRLPDTVIRRLMGVLAAAPGILFLWLGLA